MLHEVRIPLLLLQGDFGLRSVWYNLYCCMKATVVYRHSSLVIRLGKDKFS